MAAERTIVRHAILFRLAAYLAIAAVQLFAGLLTVAAGGPRQAKQSDATTGQEELVVSVKTWKGEYFCQDVPGGVESTPVTGAIYAVPAKGGEARQLTRMDGAASIVNWNGARIKRN